MRARHAGSQTGVSGTAQNGVGFSCPWRTSCASVLSFLWLGFQLIWGEDGRCRVRRMVACVLSSSCSCVLTCARTSGWNSCGAWAGTRSLKGWGQFQLRTEEPPVFLGPRTRLLLSRGGHARAPSPALGDTRLEAQRLRSSSAQTRPDSPPRT